MLNYINEPLIRNDFLINYRLCKFFKGENGYLFHQELDKEQF